MLNQSNELIKKKFLREFTKELLLVRQYEQRLKDEKKQEGERLRREIEAEKLRIKYLKDRPSEKQAEQQIQRIQQPAAQQIQTQRLISQAPVQQMPKQHMQASIMPRSSGVFPQILNLPANQPIVRLGQQNVFSSQNQENVQQNIPGFQINFGKIQSFINDPFVTSIECPGEGKNIIIKKREEVMTVDIKLTKEEIDSIIKEFSEKARIPLIEGLLRARVGILQISAIVSTLAESRFIITKISELPEEEQVIIPVQRPFISQMSQIQQQQTQNQVWRQQQPKMPQIPRPPI